MSAPKSKVLLVGMGGVGSIAAVGLEYGGKAEVTAVLRSDYQLMKDRGFHVKSCDYGEIESFRPTNVCSSIDEAMTKYGPFEFVVFSTKNVPEVNPVEPLLAKAYQPGTAVVLLQNGFGIEKSVLAKFPDAHVISGVSMISSTLYDHEVHHIAPDDVAFGVFDNKKYTFAEQEEVCKKFLSLYSNEKNNATYDPNVKYTRWRKLVYNATLNSTCALTDLDVGRVELFGGLDPIVRPAMKEIIAIAKSDGVELPEGVDEFMIRSDDGLWYPPSMLVDLRKGNYTECGVILGNALDVAKENNVPAPCLNTLYHLLSMIQYRTMEKNGKLVLPEKRPLPSDNYTLPL